MGMTNASSAKLRENLLSLQDPDPVEMINPDSSYPVLLVCEHAGQAIPQKLGNLGLSDEDLQRHIAWDIGAASVTRKLADMLGTPALLQRYSRLVIDCNRPPAAPDSSPAVSDHIPVPGNQDLSEEERRQRVREIFSPFNRAVAQALDSGTIQIVLSIHSYTPYLNGEHRPWTMGLLFRQDRKTSELLRDYVMLHHSNIHIGMNQPYQIEDASDWFVPHHGEARGLPHSLIEIRNNEIADEAGQDKWAQLLRPVIHHLLKEV